MPSTTFEDSDSAQSRALDWMLGDAYTLTLADNDRILQRFALAVFYFSTNGPTSWLFENRIAWLLPSTECEWGSELHNVGCNGDVVTAIYLVDAGLEKNLPKEIGLLSSLEYLQIFSNDLEGALPSEIGLFHDMVWMELGHNDLSGMVPAEIVNLSNLFTLDLTDTNLSGSIPSELCVPLQNAFIDCGEIECDCCTDYVDPCE
eukprot:CAMPEP_0194054978 /NCGR_PEP_ID=MMETSP0009_2-20130614/55213_1 /TAXON_ID=210454 /ORGANISM="Grammatophora oceanica, Strain CCMP 410" /LENGTH=202 /DNA_ID=CAMNT_0038703715 /DNA_START=6 /DNA_END=614 /DNA_ORIENTATION=-